VTRTDVSLAPTRDSYDALASEHPDVVNAGLDNRPHGGSGIAPGIYVIRRQRERHGPVQQCVAD
jgi:hypothetical protein